jgi:hypothetical protein
VIAQNIEYVLIVMSGEVEVKGSAIMGSQQWDEGRIGSVMTDAGEGRRGGLPEGEGG